jgi:hypothetical protein
MPGNQQPPCQRGKSHHLQSLGTKTGHAYRNFRKNAGGETSPKGDRHAQLARRTCGK